MNKNVLIQIIVDETITQKYTVINLTHFIESFFNSYYYLGLKMKKYF